MYCIHGILTYKTQKPIDFLLERNAIKIMINLVKETKSSKIILLILDSLCKFLEFEEHTNKNYKKLIENMLEESEGFQILDELQHHPDDAVFAKLESLIKQHFDSTTS